MIISVPVVAEAHSDIIIIIVPSVRGFSSGALTLDEWTPLTTTAINVARLWIQLKNVDLVDHTIFGSHATHSFVCSCKSRTAAKKPSAVACRGQAFDFAQTNGPKERRDRGRHEILIIFSLSSLDEKAVRSHKALPGTFAWNSKINKTCETNFWMKPAHTVTPRSQKAAIDTVAGANTSRFVKNKLFNNCKCFASLLAA